jgi:hypothetical protein
MRSRDFQWIDTDWMHATAEVPTHGKASGVLLFDLTEAFQ